MSFTTTQTMLDEQSLVLGGAVQSVIVEESRQLTKEAFNGLHRQMPYGDFRDDLVRDGYAVIKGAIPRKRADAYADKMFTYLEDFGLGFKRNDPATIHVDHLPYINEKGMCFGYGIPHEQFVWDIRCEPGVIEPFEKVYQTQDLLVSFDSLNFGFPNRKDIPENKPWPHQDQDPETPGFRCLQGLVNFLPNGPQDGGLIVCKGGHALSEEFHKQFKGEEDKIWAWTKEWYGFTTAGMKWLAEKGCQWEKICAGPGDLILWDSRTPHYNLSSTSSQPRFAAYTCYMPVSQATQADLLQRKIGLEEFRGTTHWPIVVNMHGLPVLRDGKPDALNTGRPKSGRPELSERGWRLTGVPYIDAVGV